MAQMIFGLVGLFGQVAAFAVVLALVARRKGTSFAALVAGVVAVYGYALAISFTALIGIPWQVVNLGLALALIVLVMTPVRSAVVEGLQHAGSHLLRAWGAVTVMAVGVLIHLSIAVVKPELSIDGQLYHGPALANIVQNGTLWGWSAANEYIFYTDLTMAGGVNLATFTGVARFDDALQIPHFLLMVLLVQWALARRFSSPFVRVSLATLLASAAVVWVQPRVLYVDLAYGVAVAACILIPVLALRLGRIELATLGIVLGAVFATKPTGILTGIVALVTIVLVTLVRRRDESVGTRVAALAVGLLPALAAATSFYVRNLIAFGNPVYPVKTTFGPVSLPGVIDLEVFASGERGSGLVDPGRIVSYLESIGTGVLHGVTKLDYDPRNGGYGYVPLMLAALFAVCLVVQLLRRHRASSASPWRAQLVIVGLALVILTIQPATFDTRYVIGPTILLVVAAFLTTAGRLPRAAELVVGSLALAMAAGQIVWNEKMIYPGASSALELRALPSIYQPATPGNPWGAAEATSWLPRDECVVIALQTSGGITESGMNERSEFGALPYALYGDRLCNDVEIITLRDREPEAPENASAVRRADYLVVYREDSDDWIAAYRELEECAIVIDETRGTEMFPQKLSVIQSTC